jgi:hypothetical protein
MKILNYVCFAFGLAFGLNQIAFGQQLTYEKVRTKLGRQTSLIPFVFGGRPIVAVNDNMAGGMNNAFLLYLTPTGDSSRIVYFNSTFSPFTPMVQSQRGYYMMGGKTIGADLYTAFGQCDTSFLAAYYFNPLVDPIRSPNQYSYIRSPIFIGKNKLVVGGIRARNVTQYSLDEAFFQYIDSLGNILQTHTQYLGLVSNIRGIQMLPDSGFLLTGSYWPGLSPSWGRAVRFSKTGQVVYNKLIYDRNKPTRYSFSNGNGNTETYLMPDGDWLVQNTRYLARYDSSGTVLRWADSSYNSGASGSPSLANINVLNDGTFQVTESSGAGLSVQKRSGNNLILWSYTIPQSGSTSIPRVGVTWVRYFNNGSVFLTGSKLNGLANSTNPYDIWYARIDNFGTPYSPTAVAPYKPPHMLNVYPNPTRDFVYFAEAGQLSLFNTSGQQVLSATLQGQQVNLSSLPSGLYLYQVALPNGEKASGRVVRE